MSGSGTGGPDAAVRPWEIGLESVDFTFVHVHEGHDAAFNTWYGNDHFYSGGVLGPGVLAGRRWYCSRALRESRYTGSRALFPQPELGTNLATYFFTHGGGAAFKHWVEPQLDIMWKTGRMFAERTIMNLSLYNFRRALAYVGASTVPPHVALDHPFPGLVVTLCSGAWPGGRTGAPPRGSLTLAFERKPAYLPLKMPDLSPFDPVTLLLTFMPRPPKPDVARIGAIARAVAKLAGAEPLWASGFLPVVPGSTRHLAELR